ncbi:MAG: YbgC/FadM family acyl-CoA thioesterase [Geminicoccaceae bacterium]|nr:YbgC/FadM family acyl-CoA thioesterase [Geminicoccaceae bacterium]MDW8341563.1 YbgC/FadM family acyl-CoA thioesterase [Geminicoccaceae bacterium]
MNDASARRFSVRVYYEDTDAGGVVYHGAYFRFAERARTEFLRSLGYDHRTLSVAHEGMVVVRRCAAEFLAPARLDDLLDLETELRHLGAATALFHQTVRRARTVLALLETTVVFVDRSGRPRRWPRELRARLAAEASRAAEAVLERGAAID